MFELTIKAIILGIIEGLTEFLPVSSTGHLIIANKFLSFEGKFANLFAVVIQVGAIFAVLFYYKDKVFPKFNGKKELKEYVSLWSKVIVGVIPAALIGIPLEDKIEELLFNPVTVALALIVGAILLIFAENRKHNVTVITDKEITYKKAFLVGCAQCLALIPGMSRSASTIIGGLFVGFSRPVAAEFSFFLALPVLMGASLIKMLKTDLILSSSEWGLLGLGTFVSFVVAYFVITVFMNYVKKHDFKVFAYYRIVLGIIVLLLVR
jgi:undecaprenyl-diphosphatase